MAERATIVLDDPRGSTSGIFSQASQSQPRNASQPLLVLIHGGGCNSSYFDNHHHSVPTSFNQLGYNVLNLNRCGYGGNEIPATKTPVFDSIPVYASFIHQVYTQNHGGRGGIVLVGHSLGAATAILLAALHGKDLPLLGVSALGIIPTRVPPSTILDRATYNPEFERVQRIGEPSADDLRRFLGVPDFFDPAKLPALMPVFEDSLTSEMIEWLSPSTYDRFVTEIAPNVQVPLQYLAAEVELGWENMDEARPVFEEAKKLFSKVPYLDADILPGGAHNFEFSNNAALLQTRREKFIAGLATPANDPAAFQKLPLLDLAKAESPATKPQFLQNLRQALLHVGFFYLTSTGIPPSATKRLTQKSIEFFELPLEEKLKVEMVHNPHFLGYARLGNEITAQKEDFREQADFLTELPAPQPDEPVYRNLHGPNQWPSEKVIPGFREAVEQYLAQATRLSERLTHLIAEALDLPPDAFDSFFDTPNPHKLKIVKYPTPDGQEGDVQGVGPHQDSSFLTLLLQATGHRGLEVQNKHGDWITAPPIDDTLVINIGCSLEALTGGFCKATTHRVNLNKANFQDTDGKSLGPRYSLPVFQGVSPDLSAKDIHLQIPQHIQDLIEDDAVKIKAQNAAHEMFQNNIGEGTFVARLISHQDVAARWYPELLEKALSGQRVA